MGFFGFGKKKDKKSLVQNQKQESRINTNVNQSISLEKKIEKVNLRKEKIGICLEKNPLIFKESRVVLILDKSGSARPFYKDGTIQNTLERLIPVAMQMDDNGEMEVWLFEAGFRRLPTISIDNVFSYTDEVINKEYGKYWGGTKYAPVMKDVADRMLKEEPDSTPVFAMFITDGNNTDKKDTKTFLKEISSDKIFWQYIGVNHKSDEFEFLQRLDDLKGRVVDNANFFQINDLNQISDDDLYNRLLDEYPDWQKEAKGKGIL